MSSNYYSLFRDLLDRFPEMESGFRLIVRRWQSNGNAPKQVSFSIQSDPRNGESWLQLGKVKQLEGNRIQLTLDGLLRDENTLTELALTLNINIQAQKILAAEFNILLQRLRLSFSDLPAEIYWLSKAKEILRQIESAPNLFSKDLYSILNTIRFLTSNESSITLSELGAKFFNDSKVLRDGYLNGLLQRLLSIHIGDGNFDCIDDILKRFGVINNPYAATVLLYGPLRYRLGNKWYDWVSTLNDLGQSAVLTWEQVQAIEEINLVNTTTIICSENLAPYQHLTANNSPELIIYTEGYPNSAVCRILELLSEKSFDVQHWGDTDLDGWLITEKIFSVAQGTLYPAMKNSSLLPFKKHKPFTNDQQLRAEKYLEQHKVVMFEDEIKYAMDKGWIEQESMLMSMASS